MEIITLDTVIGIILICHCRNFSQSNTNEKQEKRQENICLEDKHEGKWHHLITNDINKILNLENKLEKGKRECFDTCCSTTANLEQERRIKRKGEEKEEKLRL